MSKPDRRPHPVLTRLSTSTRRAIDAGCASVRRVVRNPMPLKDQAAAWLSRTPETSVDDDGPLGKARRLEAVALLGLCEVDRATQACADAITTLEEEMEENVDAVVPLRDTVTRLAGARTDLEAERTRLMESHRARKAERLALQHEKGEAPPEEETCSAAPGASQPLAALNAAGEKITDFMDALTDSIGRRLPFVKR